MHSDQVKKIVDTYYNKKLTGFKYKLIYNQIVKETSFLPEYVSIRRRFWHISNNTEKIPKCLECDAYVNWCQPSKDYSNYCSTKCMSNSKLIRIISKHTCLKNYNVEYPLQSKLIKSKSKQSNLKKYGVDNPAKSKIIKDKIKLTNLERYGIDCISQRHLSKDSLEKLKDPNYLKEQHHNQKKSLDQIAKELGLANSSALGKRFKKYNIPVFIQSSSEVEIELLDYVKSIYSKELLTNIKSIISPLELDIYLPEEKLAIEFNGLYWHSDLKKDKEYHINKTLVCLKKKIWLIHIFEDEWLNDKDNIKLKLKQILNLLPKISIHQASIKEVDDYTTILEYKEEKVAEIQFEFKDNKVILKEYNTFNFSVQNSFKYLLDYNINKHNLKSIYSYVDFNWSTNIEIYKKSNFKFIKYIENNKLRILDVNNNYFNIYDAGKLCLKKLWF